MIQNLDSYIIITCEDGADPRLNRLQLRTTPPTFIELQPGKNKLSIKDHPDLKYGFRQIEDFYIDNINCESVLSVDLSHFDSSEVTQMNNMFERMENLSHINFGSIRFKNITSIENAFDWVSAGWNAKDGYLLDLSNIDFSQVLDTTKMLYGCLSHTVNLTGCDMSKVECADDMFTNCGIRKLILDRSKLSNAVIESITQEVRNWCSLEEVSLKGCEMDTIKSIISGLTHYRPINWGSIKFIFEKTLDSKQLIGMNITATENALEFLEWHPEFNLPFTAYECFAGMTTIDGLDTPDLALGIAAMDKILTRIKDELREQIKDISPKSSSLSPSTMSLDYIVDNIDITLITEEDSKSGTYISVRNLFKYQITRNNEESYEVVCAPCPPEHKDNLLGVYLPRTGSIMLWIDRIVQKDRPELIFQKVLLHEMIHAFLDIYPRVYFKYYNRICSILTAIGKKDTTESEETIDNILVLDCYSCYHGKKYYDFVKEFISNQPDEYKAAIDMYEPKKEVYSIVKAHLNDKVSDREKFDISQSINYCILPPDEDEEDFLIDELVMFTTYLPSFVPSFFIYHKNSNGILCTRVLLGGYADFRSPWLTCKLNLSTKIFSIRIGNFLYYQFNPINRDEECFDLLNHKNIKTSKDLDFVISEYVQDSKYTWDSIYNFISVVNPDTSIF